MTSAISPPPGAPMGWRNRRRFPRYEAVLAVVMRRHDGDVVLTTGDVSRHGAFLKTTEAMPLGHVVQLRFILPQLGHVDATCMVARILGEDASRIAGVGMDFFAVSKDAKALWERFIQDLKNGVVVPLPAMAMPAAVSSTDGSPKPGDSQLPVAVGVASPPALPPVASLPSPRPPPESRPSAAPPPASPPSMGAGAPLQWGHPRDLRVALPPLVVGEESFEFGAGGDESVSPRIMPPWPAAPSAGPGWPPARPLPQGTVLPMDDDLPLPPLEGNVLFLKFPGRTALERFQREEFNGEGVFIQTTSFTKEVGSTVQVVLIHPETDDEFRLEGTVVRRVVSGPPHERGIGLFFRSPGEELGRRLQLFVDSGLEAVDLVQEVSPRQFSLEQSAAKEPDNADALEALGTFQLDEGTDLSQALHLLGRAIALAPAKASAHAALVRAYQRVGDAQRSAAHARVVLALRELAEREKATQGSPAPTPEAVDASSRQS